MNKKLRVTLEVVDNVSIKYPETKQYIEENMKEVYKRENSTVEEVFYFDVFVYIIVV